MPECKDFDPHDPDVERPEVDFSPPIAMPRGRRNAPGGIIYHVLNRANGRRTIFATPQDFAAFISVVAESLLVMPTRLLAYLLNPT